MNSDTPNPNPNPATAPAPAKPSAPAPKTASRRFVAPALVTAAVPRQETKMIHWIMLGAILVLAIGLRVKDPLSSPMIGAEDPYRHMERTWDLVQGKGFAEYPPGLNLVLLPFTFLGPDAFYVVSAYMPILFGAIMVVGMFQLTRSYMHPAGALVASLLVAVMPEMIRRTDLLFPTALDLALLPFLFLAILKISEGNRKALLPAGLLGGFVLISHPWVIALLAAPVALFAFITTWRSHKALHSKLLMAAGGVLGAGLLASFLPPMKGLIWDNAVPNVGKALTGGYSVPAFVDLPAMLTYPAIVLAAIGVFIALRRRDNFSLLALLWTGLLIPFIAIDLLGMWYVPHRTVAYLGIGIAMLGAIPVGELLRLLNDARPQAQPSATFGAVALALLVMTPTGLSVDPWYRTFTTQELDAWHAIDAMGVPYIQAGSWEARAGYRAVTGRDANYNPGFFTDALTRDVQMRDHPGLMVVVDCHTAAEGNPTDFLSGWTQVQQWGDSNCPKDQYGNLKAGYTALYKKA